MYVLPVTVHFALHIYLNVSRQLAKSSGDQLRLLSELLLSREPLLVGGSTFLRHCSSPPDFLSKEPALPVLSVSPPPPITPERWIAVQANGIR